MLPRFFAPAAGSEGSTGDITLPEDESRHATSALRLRAGDEVAVFDGRGHEWQARIHARRKSALTVTLEKRIVPAAEPRVGTLLMQAVLKGDHMDAVIRDATMLGVTEIWPIVTAHTVVSATAASGTRAQARWLRVAIASVKQCRRAVVPVVRTALPLVDVLRDSAVSGCDARIVLAEPLARGPEGKPESQRPRSAALAVGPEGGWSQEEFAHFGQAGFTALTLGALTLRADAAAIVALSVLRERWGDL